MELGSLNVASHRLGQQCQRVNDSLRWTQLNSKLTSDRCLSDTHVDSWESFFHEKSRRRAKAAQLRSVGPWVLGAVGCLVFVIAVLMYLDL